MVALKFSVLGRSSPWICDYSLMRKKASQCFAHSGISWDYSVSPLLTCANIYIHFLSMKKILVLILKHMMLKASIFFFNTEIVYNLRTEE